MEGESCSAGGAGVSLANVGAPRRAGVAKCMRSAAVLWRGGGGAGLQANRIGCCRSRDWVRGRTGRRKPCHSSAVASPECPYWSRRQESWAIWIKLFVPR